MNFYYKMTGRHLPKLVAKQPAGSMSDRVLACSLDRFERRKPPPLYIRYKGDRFPTAGIKTPPDMSWAESKKLRVGSTFFTTRRLQIRGQGKTAFDIIKNVHGYLRKKRLFPLTWRLEGVIYPLSSPESVYKWSFKACKREWSLAVSDNPSCV